jgi:RNA polymerase sigma factor (sigma-70 family)
MDETGARFWELLEPEYRRAMLFCRKLATDRERGDDLFQDALVAALTRFSGLRDEKAFRPWLYRIIVNTFRSKTRRP